MHTNVTSCLAWGRFVRGTFVMRVTKDSADFIFLSHFLTCFFYSLPSRCLFLSLFFFPCVCVCSVRGLVATCSLQKQWTHQGFIPGDNEHRSLWQGEVHLSHQYLPIWQLWQGNVSHRVEWVPFSSLWSRRRLTQGWSCTRKWYCQDAFFLPLTVAQHKHQDTTKFTT